MREETFIQKHSEDWATLDKYNKILEKKPITKMYKEEIREFTELFRETGFHLAYARTHYKNSKTTVYLNQLVGISHNHFYSRRQNAIGEVKGYFSYTFPKVLRDNINYFVAALLVFMTGAAFAAAMVLADIQNFYYFFPSNTQINANSGEVVWDHSLMSAFIMSNNILVSLNALCLGITLGVGTIFVLFYNGLILGALSAYVMMQSVDTISYWSLILPHGVIELVAIFISGAGGLIIGKHLLIPGENRRRDSLIKGAKQAGLLVPGVVIMLVVAGLIEGFFTPLPISPWIKLAFAALTAIGLAIYFFRLAKTNYNNN